MLPKSLGKRKLLGLRSGLAKSRKATVPERVPNPTQHQQHPQVIGAPWTAGRWGLGYCGQVPSPLRNAQRVSPARSPVARTHSAWVKALSPSGTAVSPFPEQSTRRSPSQLQGAAQRGGAAPLGPVEPRSPRARKQSSRSGPGIAAAAARASLSSGASRSDSLRRPPPPLGQPACGARGPDSVPRRSACALSLQQSAAAAQGRGAPQCLPSRCSMDALRQHSGSVAQASRPGPEQMPGPRAAIAASSCPGPPSAAPLLKVAERSLQPCRPSAPAPAPGLTNTLAVRALQPLLPLRASFSLLGLHARLRSPRPPGYANHLGTCKN